MDQWNLSLEKCEPLSLIHLQYNAGSLKSQSNDAIHHKLAKILKFSTTIMQCAYDNQEVFSWFLMWF